MASLQENKAGKFVAPSGESGSAALSHVNLPADMRAWLPDPKGDQSYPIATYTWLLFYKKYQFPQEGRSLTRHGCILFEGRAEDLGQDGLHTSSAKRRPRGSRHQRPFNESAANADKRDLALWA